MHRIVTVLAVIAASTAARGATPVFTFDEAASLTAWTRHPSETMHLEPSPRFATAGSSALLATTPAWKAGMAEWPAFEAKPAVADWTPYDRLVVDVTNLNGEPYLLALFVSDSKVPFRDGLSYRFELPSLGFRQYVIPLASFPESVNRADIAICHFFTERPAADFAVAIGRVALLRSDEPLPEPQPGFASQLGALASGAVQSARQTVAGERAKVASLVGAASQEAALARFSAFETQLQAFEKELGSPDLALARIDALRAEVAALAAQAGRTAESVRLQKEAADAGFPASGLVVGVATSMEKILPRDALPAIRPARKVVVQLAGNEEEAFQVAVLPVAADARGVSVSASDLTSPEGAVFPRTRIDCHVVGYVRTATRPPYAVPHVGWWPDPILDFLGPVDIAAGDVQAFWIRLRAPRDQAPGVYRGQVTLSADNVPPVSLDLEVRVHAFALPDASPLPLAITFGPIDWPLPETESAQAAWRSTQEYPVNAWRKHRFEWADFLADYYITYDSLYHRGQPDFEILTRLHEQGRLGVFNLGYYGPVEEGAEGQEPWKADHLPRLRQAYARAKELGLLDHAYIYGCDEAPAERFEQVQDAATLLRAEFPGVPVMTTTYDQSYGMDSVITSVDAFCPLTPSFDPSKAARARAAGKAVWWYICCGPHHPHANMFLEYPAIEGRLLMGAMTAKQRPDGFLYYQISIWNSEKPIASGPFTDWNPRSWTQYHGDGAWICVGPDGTPLPTIRLENFRDGLEDYAYFLLLEKLVRQCEARRASLTAEETQWLAEAQEALLPPESLVKSMTDYTLDPAAVYAWRNRLGDLLDRGGQLLNSLKR